MNYADAIVLITYVLGVLAVGILFASRNNTTSDMFVAGSASPWWVAGLSGFMTMFSAGTFVVWGGIAYKYGLVAVMINVCYGVAAILAGRTVAGRWKDSGIQTPAEYVRLRFGTRALHFCTAAIMSFKMISTAVAVYSLCVLMVAMLPSDFLGYATDAGGSDALLQGAILLLGGGVIVYTMIGGLWGVLMTDVLQFIVLNVAVLFVVPLALSDVGGLRTFVESAPKGFFAPTGGDYTWLFLAGWVAIHYFVVGAEWAFVQRYLCVPTERDARKGAYLFGVLYLVSPALWLLPPMIQRVRVPLPQDATPAVTQSLAETAYIDACQAILPPGMIGLILAAMFSATASMISSQLNVFAGVLTSDIVRPWLNNGTSERQLVWIGRGLTGLLGSVIIGLALLIPSLGGAESVIVPATSLMVGPLLAPLLVGLLSKRLPIASIRVTAAVSCALVLIFKIGQHNPKLVSAVPGAIGLVNWLLSIGKLADIFVGLVIPVSVVLLCLLASQSVSPGWTELLSVGGRDQLGEPTSASDKPATIVAWSLAICGMMIAGIAVFTEKGFLVLALFAATLFVLAALVFYAKSAVNPFRSHRAPDVET